MKKVESLVRHSFSSEAKIFFDKFSVIVSSILTSFSETHSYYITQANLIFSSIIGMSFIIFN